MRYQIAPLMRAARSLLNPDLSHQTANVQLAATAALLILIVSGCVSERSDRPPQASAQTSRGVSVADARAQATHQARLNATIGVLQPLPLMVAPSTTNQAPSSSATAIANAPALVHGCVALDRYHSAQSGITLGQWRLTNNCGMGITISVLPDPGQTVVESTAMNLAPGQVFIAPSYRIESIKYFACPSPWAPFDSTSSPGHVIAPRYETTKIVCLIVDASGDAR